MVIIITTIPFNDNFCYYVNLLNFLLQFFQDVDTANILGQNSVEIGSLESNSIRVTTGSGNMK
jgi:hypothetical protein